MLNQKMPRGARAALVGSELIQSSGDPGQFPLPAASAFGHRVAWNPFLTIASTVKAFRMKKN